MIWASALETVLAALMGGTLAAIGLILLRYMAPEQRRSARDLLLEAEDRVAFLLDGPVLVDATPNAMALLDRSKAFGSDWDRIVSVLRPGFPEIGTNLADLGTRQTAKIAGSGACIGQTLEAEYWDGLVRIMIDRGDDGTATLAEPDQISLMALEEELSTLRALAEDSPQLIWKTDTAGEIIWANRAYLDRAFALGGSANEAGVALSWPPPALFEQLGSAPLHGDAARRRAPAKGPKGSDQIDWFEITSMRRGTESVHFAIEANGLVKAEKAQRDFVQTLTKTFAQLNVGMIVFDRNRRLVLFNPAFLDMTGLPVDFLSARPVIQSVLDRLREAGVLPEPKDYTSWRDQMSALVSAARDGSYSETWDLPTGQTLRVTGRPHPNGAIAFIFEDISTEVSLTRRFRSELEFGQSVIDHIDEAVVVFSATGNLVATNRIYDALWSFDSTSALADVRASEIIAGWRQKCAPSSLWSDLGSFVQSHEGRGEWAEDIRMLDGRHLTCRFIPLPGRATMITFRSHSGEKETGHDTDYDVPANNLGKLIAAR